MASPVKSSAPSPAAMATSALASKGRLVWLPVEDEDAWVIAAVERIDGSGELRATRLHAPAGISKTSTLSEEELSAMLPVSGNMDEPVPDLTLLESISTGAVLHTLRQRHATQQIYTSIGQIILALNPFQQTKESTPARLKELADEEDPDKLPPHAFNVARSAYTVMAHTGRPRAILVSGESGAGKTGDSKDMHGLPCAALRIARAFNNARSRVWAAP